MQTFGRPSASVGPSSASFPRLPEPKISSLSSLSSSQSVRDFSASSTLSASSSGSSSDSRQMRRNVLTADLGFGNIIAPKNRRPKFDLDLQIHDLNNVPLVSGQAYIKWYIEGSPRADCRSRTNREPIKEHKVIWNYSHTISAIRMVIGKQNILQDMNIVLEVHQEYSGARERIQLGSVKLNLAAYAGLNQETRRYLMQDSKINSTVKIGINLHQTSGDRHFKTPPLKGAQVFSGIAGIIGEQRDLDDTRDLRAMDSKNLEAGAAQDIYRRTLAASWQLHAGELNPDDCIEDIFAGGDGWTSSVNRCRKPKSVRLFDLGRKDSDSDSLSQLSAGESTPTTSMMGEKRGSFLTAEPTGEKKRGYALSIVTRRSGKMSPNTEKKFQEVDEMEARDNLVSWRMPGLASKR